MWEDNGKREEKLAEFIIYVEYWKAFRVPYWNIYSIC